MDELKSNPVRKSLLTPILFMGGERELALMTILVSVTLVVMVQTLIALVIGIGLYLIAMPLLRAMAKRDPNMSKVYSRSLSFQSYYPAAATIHVKSDRYKQTSIKIKR